MNTALAKDKLSKILVGGYQEGIPASCVSKNLVVCNAWREFSNIDHCMTVLPELSHNLLIDTLIRQQVHLEWLMIG